MSKKMDSSRFIDPSLPQLYQLLLGRMVSIEELGSLVIREIKTAHAFRYTEKVKELANILINLPVKEYRLIGQYYVVWCKCRESQYDSQTLESIIDHTHTHKTKALLSRAAMEGYQRNIEREFYFYNEASKTQPTISEHIDILKSIAVIKAKEGFHESALREIENIIPIIRHAEPLVYFDVLNSYAVELGELGRKNEARGIIEHVLASPYAFAYPEWGETAADLKQQNRSFVVPDQSSAHTGMLLRMPQSEHVEPRKLNRPAKVINLQEWKKQMSKDERDDGKLTAKELKAMTASEKLIYIMQSISADFADDDFDKVIELLDQINEKKKNKPFL